MVKAGVSTVEGWRERGGNGGGGGGGGTENDSPIIKPASVPHRFVLNEVSSGIDSRLNHAMLPGPAPE